MKKVVIIGAGPAGLTAAFELLKNSKDYEVAVLEESDELGGISKTVRYNGNRMDIGGHRFFSKSDEVMSWWQERMPLQGAPAFDDVKLGRLKPLQKGGPDPETEDRVMLVRDRVSRIFYKGKFFDYPVTLKPATLVNMGFITTVRAGFSYIAARIRKRPENSLEDFYINRFGKVLYSMFFEDYTEKLWGRHPSLISADWGAQRVKGLSIGAVLRDMFGKLFGKKNKENTETSLIEQFRYPKLGPGQLWEEVAREIEFMGGRIIRSCKVLKLNSDGEKIIHAVCDIGGKKMMLPADIFISSMPVKDLVTGISGELPPVEVYDAAVGLPYRDFVTVGLLVKKLGLKNKTKMKTLGDIVPDCWIYVQDRSVKLGRIQIFNNWSPYMLADPENTVWLGLEYFCSEGDDFWNLSNSELCDFAVSELVKMKVISRDDVLDCHTEHVKKAYPAYFDTYEKIDVIKEYLNSINNLYCIGRNGQHRYNNMDHSMLTAMRAADVILHGGSKEVIWNVNTEKDYHEKK